MGASTHTWSTVVIGSRSSEEAPVIHVSGASSDGQP